MTKEPISYAEFSRLDIRTAQVTAAEAVEGADRLLKITLDVGELGERVVVSGIREWYSPEQLVGQSVVYLANLEPRTIRGVESQGMLLAAGETEATLLALEPFSNRASLIATGSVVR